MDEPIAPISQDPSAAAAPTSSRCAAGKLAAVGLLVAISGPMVYMLLLDQPFLRRTALPAWVLMAGGLAISAVAVRRDARLRVRVMAAITLLGTAAFAWLFFSVWELPQTAAFDGLEAAPDFAIADHTGTSVTLSQVYAEGPVLLVFYRGHW